MTTQDPARVVAAVDLGATSGRVMAGHLTGGASHPEVHLEEVARFPNGPVPMHSGLHWNFTGLFKNLAEGVSTAIHEHEAASMAVDSWAVDYGLLRGGRLLGEPFHYRDQRTVDGVRHVHGEIGFTELYERTGLQFLPFNTVYQFAAEHGEGIADIADSLLLIPDLVAFQLTGERITERTNASTTGLLNIHTGNWDLEILSAAQFPRQLLAPLVGPGELIGGVSARASENWAIPRGFPVLSVGSHDTASAIVAVPMAPEQAAYISCGTWGLVGVELTSPVTSAGAREANFTNEGGVDGRVRFLRNVMGLWLLSESIRTWSELDKATRTGAGDGGTSVVVLLQEAAETDVTRSPDSWLFDANDPVFLTPGDIPARIQRWFTTRGLSAPVTRAQVVRSIIESLAHAFADTVHRAAKISGVDVDTIHIVGGGSLNELLCQRTADRSGLPVLAGPVEATAVGNVLVQARYHRWITGHLEDLRAIVRSTFTPIKYVPRP